MLALISGANGSHPPGQRNHVINLS